MNILFEFYPKATRNLFNDLSIGYNRHTHNSEEVVDEKQASLWFNEEWEKAKKRVYQREIGDHLPCFYISFLLGNRRFNSMIPFWEAVKEGNLVRACVFLGNSKEFGNKPELVTYLSDSILKGESSNESRKRLDAEVARIIRRGQE